MKGLLPLIENFVREIGDDVELKTYLGADPVCYTERPADSATAPFFVLDQISSAPFADQTYQGVDYLMQVSCFALRREQGTERGPILLGKLTDRIAALFHDNDGFDLIESLAAEPVERVNAAPGSYPVTGPRNRLMLRQFVSGQLFSDADERWASGVVRFRCIVTTNRS